MLSRQLEELNLLRCSLLPGEKLIFVPSSNNADLSWSDLLDSYSENNIGPESERRTSEAVKSLQPVHFQIRADNSDTYFDVELSSYDGSSLEESRVTVSVKGEHLGRRDQERWQSIIKDKLGELQDSEYPIYELISTHLLPLLHTECASEETSPPNQEPTDVQHGTAPRYHALLTSHHLKSPNKRRSLQQWHNELSLTGFAKVGHPGVIYAEGEQAQVEQFVANVKAMQWLALRVRFVEPLPESENRTEQERRNTEKGSWKEFEKIGDVVEEMRRLRREKHVVEMGIGSAGNTPSR
ncbi:uncharacterized protein LAESUDRAFT_745174 [Laetiporus sulphureus 93-53]|uniref:Small nuclear ribonucleoprotein Prp3 C-terminal domain-containing protein n=1 Tax=Laetiporus sulphureus 93-53 TaxID=1314785 RepID=A0A165C1T7_9APHY|nr:uncharacterized protein LAESUDRAFT_745174 [Laetiporus sulphureus 93-53]KZT02047.1 hypothetical protein LAESUDRAFT_745174 [Laetiporus sulphureus 93-53]